MLNNDLREIDKWCAEQCGVEIKTHAPDHDVETYAYMKGVWEVWTIEDPRCREIVRERFGINTITRDSGLWVGVYRNVHQSEGNKTIAEAEIACITAIWEARDE